MYYWRLASVPELRGVPARDRREWWREAKLHGRRGWRCRIMLAASIVIALAAVDGSDVIRHWILPARLVACGALAGLLGLAIEHWYVQPRARRWLREVLSTAA